MISIYFDSPVLYRGSILEKVPAHHLLYLILDTIMKQIISRFYLLQKKSCSIFALERILTIHQVDRCPISTKPLKQSRLQFFLTPSNLPILIPYYPPILIPSYLSIFFQVSNAERYSLPSLHFRFMHKKELSAIQMINLDILRSSCQ